MCGRFVLDMTAKEVEKRFHADVSKKLEKSLQNFNAAPSQKLPIITNTDPGKVHFSTWGFLPVWADSEKFRSMINARGETINEKPFWKAAFRNNRCLILANGFFEWSRKGEEKLPYYITTKTKTPISFAGVFSDREEEGETFAIVTTKSNSLVGRIHDRMPVILDKKEEKIWLDSGMDPEALTHMLDTYSPSKMRMWRVTKMMNSPKFRTKEAIDKLKE